MVDPFSILGAIGFSLGFLGFIASGIENSATHYEALRNCDNCLRVYRHRLSHCGSRLQGWCQRWYGRHGDLRMSDDSRRRLWTREGYTEIQDRLQYLHQSVHDLKNMLWHTPRSLGKSLRPSKASDWSLLESELEAFLSLPEDSRTRQWNSLRPSCSVGAIRRLKFALYNNKLIGNKIGSIANALDGLESVSNDRYQNQLLEPSKTIPSYLQLRRNDKEYVLSKSLAKFINELYSAAVESWDTTEWALELRTPSARESLTVEPLAEIDFAIRHRPLTFEGTIDPPRRAFYWERVRVFYRYNECYPQSGKEVVRRIRESLEVQEPARDEDVFIVQGSTIEEHLISLREWLQAQPSLWRSSARPRSSQAADEQATYQEQRFPNIERARLAYGLIHWLLILWGTPWASRPCSCIIYRTRLVDQQHCYILEDTKCEHQNELLHHRATQHKLALIGTMLIEIALLQPLTAVWSSEAELSFTSPKSHDHFGIDLALTRVGDELSQVYMNAVRICLEYNSRCQSNELRPEDMQFIEEEVMKPLRHFYNKLSESQSRHQPRARKNPDT